MICVYPNSPTLMTMLQSNVNLFCAFMQASLKPYFLRVFSRFSVIIGAILPCQSLLYTR